MYDTYQPKPNPTIRLGLAFGVSAGMLDSLNDVFLAAHQHVSDSTLAALTIAGLVAVFAGPFASALLTSHEVGTTKSGALAGLLTGLVGSLTGSTVYVVALAIDPNAFTQVAAQQLGISVPASLQGQFDQLAMGAALESVCCGAVVWMVLGSGLGAIGGLIGTALSHSGGPGTYRPAPYRVMAPPPGPFPPGAYPGYYSPPELAPDKPPAPYMPGGSPYGPQPAPWPPITYGPPRPGTSGPVPGGSGALPPDGYGPPPPGTYPPPPGYPPHPGTSGPMPVQGPYPPPAPPSYEGDR